MGNVNSQDKDGVTQLHRAALVNDTEKLLKLVTNGKTYLNFKDKYDMTPLHRAAEKNF